MASVQCDLQWAHGDAALGLPPEHALTAVHGAWEAPGRLGGLLDRPAEPDRTIPTASQLLQAPGPAMSSSKSGFKAKLDNFQQRFKSLLGAKAQVGRPDLWLGADRSALTSLPRPPAGVHGGAAPAAAASCCRQGAGRGRLQGLQ